jgi:hypothetical protein
MASSWIDAILSPLRAAADVTGGLMAIRDTVKFGEAVIRLQAEIMKAQQGAMDAQGREAELSQEIHSLKSQLEQLHHWETEKRRYALTELPPGVFVYTLRAGMEDGEPRHHICPTCFQRGKKYVLHANEPINGLQKLSCHECGTKLTTGHFPAPSHAISDQGGGWLAR